MIKKKKVETLRENEEYVKAYDDSKFEKPSVTADIVIFEMFDSEENNYRKISEKKSKVLLIQRGMEPFKDCYALPGGFVRPEENVCEAAERELQEETNLNCDFLEQFGTYSDPERDPRRWIITNGFMALVSSNHEIIKAGDDASAAKWFNVSFKEVDGEWLLRLTHEEDVICARLKEISSQWDVKKSLKQ